MAYTYTHYSNCTHPDCRKPETSLPSEDVLEWLCDQCIGRLRLEEGTLVYVYSAEFRGSLCNRCLAKVIWNCDWMDDSCGDPPVPALGMDLKPEFLGTHAISRRSDRHNCRLTEHPLALLHRCILY